MHKGAGDIRIVYNDTSSGLNVDLWYPHYSLTTVNNTLRSIEECIFVSDRDVCRGVPRLRFVKEVNPSYGFDITNMRSKYH